MPIARLDVTPGSGENWRPDRSRDSDGWRLDKGRAVSEQIEASISDELARLKSRSQPVGESLTECAECGEPIPPARAAAIPGVKLCVDCQSERDGRYKARGGFNRRGSKDSQLK